MDNRTNDEKFLNAVNELFNEKIPFNKVLGLKVALISYERVKVLIPMRTELMGHFKRGMVHGGVISSVLDVTGGLAAFMGVQGKMVDGSLETKLEKFGRVSTIDIRVDFLRPGLGKWFVATAYTLRTGKKVAVARIELHNDQDELIAVGTGSYTVA